MSDPILSHAVKALIEASVAVTDLVTDRVSSDFLPQGFKFPAVVFHVLTEDARDCLDGPLGFDDATIQVDSMARNRTEATQLSQAVRRQLAGYIGTVAGVRLKITQSTGQSYQFDGPDDGSDQRVFRTTQDFSINYHSMESF